jgi:hypothetical protein
MNQLESRQYDQGKCSIDEYIDGFKELVEKAEYTDGWAIVMKFRQGLDPSIQSCITLMLDGRPKDDDPPVWYTAVRTVVLIYVSKIYIYYTQLVSITDDPPPCILWPCALVG